MTWYDGIRIAIASLFENPLRSFLTLLGIAISVTAVVLVVSVINGLDLYVANAIGDLKPDVFIVNRFGIIKNHEEWQKAARRNPDVRNEDAEAIRRQSSLALRVGTQSGGKSTIKFRSKSLEGIEIRAVSAGILDMEGIEIESGRELTEPEIERAVPVCVLGWDVAQNLFTPLDPIGRKVRVWGRSFRVVGVAAKRGSAFGESKDQRVMIPITWFQKTSGSDLIGAISVQAGHPSLLPAAIDEVRGIMRARHRLRFHEEDDFGIITASGVMDMWNNMTRMIFGVAVFIVSISLVVGGIVIMNIMLLTVVERTREIGVRKAVGARQRDIRFQFLVESIVLCAVGGLLGVGIGWVGSWAVSTFTPLPSSFPLWAPALAVTVTSIVGVFFGLHPAKQAARLDPIEALRSMTT